MAITKWWFSSNAMTVQVDIDENDIIVATAPIVRRFVNQPAVNLWRWMEKQGSFKCEQLK